jgi:hypothetical protein
VGHGAYFAVTIVPMRFIPEGGSVADLNDMALLIFRSLLEMPSRCVHLRTSPHLLT